MPRKVAVRKADLWKSIRLHCLHCCGHSRAEVAECPARECSLWAFRFGQAEPPRENETTRTHIAEFSR